MMKRNEVWARLVETATVIGKQLDDRRPEAAQTAAAEGAAATKKGRGRFWLEGRGFKYVDDVEDHLHRLFRGFDMLDPPEGSSVFEIGPGNCYLLYMCREMRGCRVAGVDWKLEESPAAVKAVDKPLRNLGLYIQGLFRRQLGMEEVVRHQVVRAFEPIDFRGRYDAIVATHTAFNVSWGVDAFRYWFKDCYEHLNPCGRLMIALNKARPAVVDVFPFLLPPEPTPGFKKLTLISRDTLGAAAQDVA